jgi:hypothetical protein
MKNPILLAGLAGLLFTGGANAQAANPGGHSLAAVLARTEVAPQSTSLALARSDIANQKKFIIANNLPMSEAEAAVFWPLHRAYESDLGELNEQKFGVLERYARHFDTMTDREAQALAMDLFILEEKNTSLRRNYFKRFAKIMPVTKAARFFQIENQLNLALDLQVKASVPLIQ